MKKIFTLALLAFSTSVSATTYEIVGPCSEQPQHQGEYSLTEPTSVAFMTKTILDQLQVPYIEAGAGFSSILQTPIGSASIEYVSPSELRAYGWCYSVDGVEPSLMPGDYVLQGPEHVRWWYAFSRMVEGKWVSYCEPAYTVKPAALCAKVRTHFSK